MTPLSSADVSRHWDVIVIGTGVGGGTVGHSLAMRGLSVLFLEKGSRTAAGVASGAESNAAVTPDARLANGWWPHPITHRQSNGDYRRFFAAVGCALGGSSIHYAAALERMSPSDFDQLQTPHGLLAPWPVDFKDFNRFYEAAEALYGLGNGSAAATMQRLSEWDCALMNQMRANGLNPEPLRVAIRYDQQCEECIGVVCPRNCKFDARVACLEEALRQPNCQILEQCDVQSLDADEHRVHTVHATCRGGALQLRANVIVLAAGAMHSPQVLLRSKNQFWPEGLANSSDQVGRNLMFHTSDIFALWAPRRLNRQTRQKKSISVRDFYLHDGRRLGYVQSMGLDAGRGEIAGFIKDLLRRRGLRNEFMLSLLAKMPSHIGALMFGNAGIFAAMTEDDPNPENRIILDPDEPDGASFSYTLKEDLRLRADALRRAFSHSVRPWRLLRITGKLDMNYGHPCGTCRFGIDRSTSVLDPNCRTHDIENLYVVDASFMPRSGAVNPSLTIAANALRVAPHIVAHCAALPPQLAVAQRITQRSAED